MCTGYWWALAVTGSTHACTERNWEQSLGYQLNLVVIVAFISVVIHVPYAKNMLNSKQEALTLPKVHTHIHTHYPYILWTNTYIYRKLTMLLHTQKYAGWIGPTNAPPPQMPPSRFRWSIICTNSVLLYWTSLRKIKIECLSVSHLLILQLLMDVHSSIQCLLQTLFNFHLVQQTLYILSFCNERRIIFFFILSDFFFRTIAGYS